MSETHEIVPAHLAIQSMRDNGYKNTAYAVAELIDNSLQWGAKNVELLIAEQEIQLKSHTSTRIQSIAVLDDGDGMDENTLRISLQFGNGKNLLPEKQKGMGKFGMGLPASSISQCKKVEVWSWQNGVDKAYYTYLDLDAVRKKEIIEIPKPIHKKIPSVYTSVSKQIGKSGTLIVWTELDRIIWRTATALINNSELFIGRIYRRFIEKGKAKIRMVAFNIENPNEIRIDKEALPNDPIYLMSHTSCPAPYSKKPMFEKYGGDAFEIPFDIDFKGKINKVFVRFTVAKEETRIGKVNPGSLPYGKHAAKNSGVSVIRADREIELDKSWVNPSDPRDRWWGVEVEFPPELDELFGLSNNKQNVRIFSQSASLDIEEELSGGKTIREFKEELKADEDPILPFIEIVDRINGTLGQLRNHLRVQTAGQRTVRNVYADDSPEKKGTTVTLERIEDGYKTQNDIQGDHLENTQKNKIISQELENEGYSPENATGLSATVVKENLKFVFAEADLQTSAFFTVRPKAGIIIITLNLNHPAYEKLVEILWEENYDTADREELRDRLIKARDGLKLLLMAWARYEDELPDGKRKDEAQNVRNDWGSLANKFMRENE